MSAPQFTPAPWQIVDNRHLNDAYWICAPDEFTSHAEVRAGSGEAEDAGDMLANARLIAAAPDLYEALTQAREVIEAERLTLVECATLPPAHDPATLDPETKPYVEALDRMLAKIDAAVAKARGEA